MGIRTGGGMSYNKKLVIKGKNKKQIIYMVKAGNEIIWEGTDIHKQFKQLKSAHKDKNLIIAWKQSKESTRV
jgi:hypothetical protein